MITALLLLSLAVPQDPPETKRPPKKGDTVSVRGCLTGGVVEAGELSRADGEIEAIVPYDYRLTGDKKLLKSLKEDHARHVDVLTGVLKTDLPRDSQGLSARVGNTRIGFGMPTPAGAPPRALPVLEVESLEHTDVRCR